MIIRKVGVVAILLAIVACAGGAETEAAAGDGEQQADGSSVSYTMKDMDRQVEDDASPLGYWDINKNYPEFFSKSAPSIAGSLNDRVSQLMEKYSCDSAGDETFSTHHVFLNEKLMSMRYEAMWMCSFMPSPDSSSGALNVHIADGENIVLRDQFEGEEAYSRFVDQALKRLTEKAKSKDADCAAVNSLGDFYLDEDELVVVSPRGNHAESACEVEASFDRSAIAEQLRPNSVIR